MVCIHVLVLPQSSVATQVRVMVSSCGHAPPTVTSVEVMVGVASQLSVAVAFPVLPGKVLAVHSMVVLAGHEIAGGTLSSITIVCTQLLVLPQSSVATHVRVMVLSSGHDPPIVTSVDVRVGVASQLSVAVAVPVSAGNVLPEHWIVTFAGHAMIGATLSSTTIV